MLVVPASIANHTYVAPSRKLREIMPPSPGPSGKLRKPLVKPMDGSIIPASASLGSGMRTVRVTAAAPVHGLCEVKVTVCPARTVWSAGCAVMTGRHGRIPSKARALDSVPAALLTITE